MDLPAAVQRSCEAALLAESAIHAGRPEEIAQLVGRLYDPPLLKPAVVPRPGETATEALARAYGQAGADAVRGFLTETVLTLAIAITGWAQATGRPTEEIATELIEATGGSR